MNKKSILVLAAVTVLVVAAALITRQSQQTTTTFTQGLYYPELLTQVNDVARVSVKDAGSAVTLLKDGDHWKVEEKDRYPASEQRVRELILGVARLERLEGKTRNPDLYAKLEVADISEPGSKSRLIQLQDDAGKDLAVLIVGKQRTVQGGASGRDQIYVRSPGKPQAWLVEGSIPRADDAVDWIDKNIIAADLGEVRSVSVTGADGSIRVSREDADAKEFKLEDLGPDQEIESQYAVDQIAQSFKQLRLEDVNPASDLNLDPAGAIKAVLETFDGVKVTLLVETRDDQVLGQLHADYSREDADETIQSRVEDWNELWSKWVYVLPDYQVENITVKKEDLIKQEEEG